MDQIHEVINEFIDEQVKKENQRIFEHSCSNGAFKGLSVEEALQVAKSKDRVQVILCNKETRNELMSVLGNWDALKNIQFVVYEFIEDGQVFHVVSESIRKSILQSFQIHTNIIHLKNCPRCGGVASIKKHTEFDGHVRYETKNVECMICGLQTKRKVCNGYYEQYYTDEEAAADWNTRKPVENVIDMLEAECDKNRDKGIEFEKEGMHQMAVKYDNRRYAFMHALKIIKEEVG